MANDEERFVEVTCAKYIKTLIQSKGTRDMTSATTATLKLTEGMQRSALTSNTEEVAFVRISRPQPVGQQFLKSERFFFFKDIVISCSSDSQLTEVDLVMAGTGPCLTADQYARRWLSIPLGQN